MTVVLIIEDEQPIRENLVRMLKYQGFQLLAAENGQRGVEMAQQHLPDLILCDIMMPELDGYGVLQMLRQTPDTAGIPFIFLTARSARADLRQGMNLGADDYLTKPFTSGELIEAVSCRLAKQAATIQPYRDEMQRAADHLSRLAYTDSLTQLPNRIRFRHWVQERVQRQQRFAVVCLNVDRFRSINATWGGGIGDALLQAIAQRLQSLALTARLYGDEFSLIVDLPAKITTEADLTSLMQQLLTAITQPYSLQGTPLSLQVSVGIALFPDHATQADRLMVHADTARRWQRQRGGNGCLLYRPELEAQDVAQRLLETDLNLALEKSQFQLHYQPQVDANTGRLIGMEALLRWHHPSRGFVPPDQFIPLAEASDLIVRIGEWVLHQACQETKWLQAFAPMPLRVSVNLSARQFQQHTLLQQVQRVLEQTQFDARQLVIELTETSVMNNVDQAVQTLDALKQLGIDISVDDFGTGYSSLNYLHRLPLDVLKIDRSFVNQVTQSDRDAAIAAAIISMAKNLKLKVIAEGVETVEQLAFLQQHGCHLIQGYLYSRPLPAPGIQALLAQNAPLKPVPSNGPSH
jgi:diguanylate cyclase